MNIHKTTGKCLAQGQDFATADNSANKEVGRAVKGRKGRALERTDDVLIEVRLGGQPQGGCMWWSLESIGHKSHLNLSTEQSVLGDVDFKHKIELHSGSHAGMRQNERSELIKNTSQSGPTARR